MENLLDWLDVKPRASKAATLGAVAAAPLVALLAVALLLPAAAPIAGCGAGIGLFLAAYGYWHTLLDPSTQERTNLKARTPLSKRRVAAAVVVTLWAIVLLLTGDVVPAPLLGTLNVFVLLSIVSFFRATPDEAAAALAAYQSAQEEKARAAEGHSDDPQPSDPVA